VYVLVVCVAVSVVVCVVSVSVCVVCVTVMVVPAPSTVGEMVLSTVMLQPAFVFEATASQITTVHKSGGNAANASSTIEELELAAVM